MHTHALQTPIYTVPTLDKLNIPSFEQQMRKKLIIQIYYGEIGWLVDVFVIPALDRSMRFEYCYCRTTTDDDLLLNVIIV